MERLTVKCDDTTFMPKAMCSVGRDGFVDDCDSCIECCENNIDNMCNDCPIHECFNRLAEYEDTDLTPEKIQAMDKEFSVQAKELMEYRNIGTVEEIREAAEKIAIAHELFGNESIIKEAMEKLRKVADEFTEYREIGTVEDCRETMEKQREKKPVLYGDYEDGRLECPNCKEELMDLEECGFHFCPYCGQAIDWSEIE